MAEGNFLGVINALNRIVDAIKNLTTSQGKLTKTGFLAWGSSTSCVANATTEIVFINEVEDTDNAFDLTKFVVPAGKGGIYLFSAIGAITPDSGVKLAGYLLKNGTRVCTLNRQVPGASEICATGGASFLEVEAGDEITFAIYHTSATDKTISATTRVYANFSGYKLFD